MFTKAFFSLIVLAASVTAAVPSVSKRATCSNGKTTANDAVKFVRYFDLRWMLIGRSSAVFGLMSSTTSKLTCEPSCTMHCIQSGSLNLTTASMVATAARTRMKRCG